MGFCTGCCNLRWIWHSISTLQTIFSVSAHAISCYKCVSYSNGDPWCADDFDKTKAPNPVDCDAWAKEQKLEERPDACYKIVQNIHRIVKGKWFKPVVSKYKIIMGNSSNLLCVSTK